MPPRKAPLVRTASFQRNFDRYRHKAGTMPCARCSKAVVVEKAAWVHLIDGGSMLLHPADERLYTSDAGDLFYYPVGPDCAEALGEYASRGDDPIGSWENPI